MTIEAAPNISLAEQTVPSMLERQAERYGDAPLVHVAGTSYTYRGLRDAVALRAGDLARLGVEPGDRVALIAPNRYETLELILGSMWLGATIVPLNTAVRGGALEHMMQNSGARMLIVEDGCRAALDSIRRELPELESVWLLGAERGGRFGPFEVAPLPSFGDAIDPNQAAGGDTAAILYTSGTTGPSKGVCCPHAQLYWFGVLGGRLLGVGEDDILHTTLPLFHINAMTAVLQAMLVGASLVVEPRFSASRFWSRLHESHASVTYLLGAMVQMVVNQAPTPLDRDHDVRVALAPATPRELYGTVRERFGITLVEGYASTETNVAIGLVGAPQRPGCMGTVQPGFAAKVVDDNDVAVDDGVPGELVLRHHEPFAFATGYYRMPEKTVEAWRNLWFHTGDRVVRDEEGCLRFVDRLKESIRRRGENISSWEVEQALLSHPTVAEAAVFPVPSELGEDEVMAAVVPRASHSLDPSELVEHCGPRLAAFAVPRFFDVLEELPLTESGKIQKYVLRERGVTDGTWDREIHRPRR